MRSRSEFGKLGTKMSLDRRTFLRGSAATLPLIASCTPLAALRPSAAPFLHGVASGDPLADRVILWTRVTRGTGTAEGRVAWRIARDPDFERVVASGEAFARASRDYTVKVDAVGLAPDTTYYYRFEALGESSPIGRTRTLPVGPTPRLRLGFCSCSNYARGFFNAYGRLAERADLAAVLHLGDYIYEYGGWGAGSAVVRVPEPHREIVHLADYRMRHAHYRRDADLQEMHRQHPVIALWDDHELANNAWRGGAQNHQRGEGSWRARRSAAVRAYLEWLPVRESDERYYRRFRFGDLADLLMLETRLRRDKQVADRSNRAAFRRRDRTLLGPKQESWLLDGIDRSARDGVAWRVFGQQVVFAPMPGEEGRVRNPDSWDGYPVTRERIFDLWERRGIADNLVLTGDVHSSWAIEVPRDPRDRDAYDPTTGRGAHAVEFVTPGISSPGPVAPAEADRAERRVLDENPNVRWVELASCGYSLLDLDHERVQCDWFHVDTVREPSRGERFAAGYRARRGSGRLEPVDAPSAPPRDVPERAP